MKKLTLLMLISAMSQSAYAVPYLLPERCAHDSLNQWNEGQPLEGTARGRNQWLKVCHPIAYKITFVTSEKDPSLPDRLAYPTYGIITGSDGRGTPIFINNGWTAPSTPPLSSGATECAVSEPNEFVGLCTSGCVTPDSLVATPGGEFSIGVMRGENHDSVLVPVQNSQHAFLLEPNKVKRYVSDRIAANQDVYVVTTMSGAKLQLSENHPMLTGKNVMAQAKDLRAGDALITADGKIDLITEVSKQKYFGRLYNLTVDTKRREKSLYVVEGFISGDKKIQDESVAELNRRMFRDFATRGI